jgi:hypothetical protein
MKKLILFFILIVLFSTCKKNENDDFIWEKSFGKGKALFLNATSDSGFVACGEKEGKPYVIRFNKSKKVILDFQDGNEGSFSSVWFDTTSYITGGFSLKKLLLARYSNNGIKVWEKLFDPGFEVGNAKLFQTGNGNILAMGTAAAGSAISGATGLLFVEFDTIGNVLSENTITDNSFISASGAIRDNDGNIYLAITRRIAGGKSKASVAKYNNVLQKLWETDLFTNPAFGGAGMAVTTDPSGNVYIAGNTELSTDEGVLTTSFIASLTGNGTISWSRYLEKSNSGSAIKIDGNNKLLMLNTNCYIINLLETSTGEDAGRIRTFSLCDSYNTDALSADMDISFDKNYLLAGSRGGSFYIALKPAQ